MKQLYHIQAIYITIDEAFSHVSNNAIRLLGNINESGKLNLHANDMLVSFNVTANLGIFTERELANVLHRSTLDWSQHVIQMCV